jgi:hypothetical protein
MTNELVMFIMQGLLTVAMLGFASVLNTFRKSFEEVNRDLKALNNAVLGQYITRDDSDQKWAAQRILDHELRSLLQDVMVKQARLEGVPYNYNGPEKRAHRSEPT